MAREIATGSPKMDGWIYGKCQESFGWIDKNKFRKMFSEEFTGLELSDIPKE